MNGDQLLADPDLFSHCVTEVPRGQDDLLVSAALCAALEDARWGAGESFVIPGVDPIEEMDRAWRRPRLW